MPADQTAAAPKPVRPTLAYRVGVTGARKLDPELVEKLREETERVLQLVKDEVAAVGAKRRAARVYRTEADGSVRPLLRLLSPLAQGADRIVAEAGQALGYRLDVAMPFPREDYETDFGGDTLDRWLGPVSEDKGEGYFALDGAHGAEANRSYEAVGRLVVRNCDLLIAIWDGEPAAGRGGTAEIVRFSARFGPPVLWIDARLRNPPRLVRSVADLRWPDEAPAGEAAFAELRKTIAAAIEPPDPRVPHAHGLVEAIVKRIGGKNAFETDPLKSYFAEKPRRQRPFWKLHGKVFRPPSAKTGAATAASSAQRAGGEPSYWEAIYRPADRASVDYRDRYRSSYVWVFGLAALAAVCAVLAVAFEGLKPFATPVELLALMAIGAFVVVNQTRAWHGRWIAYRLLAELCRKQEALAWFGWSLPPANLRRVGGARSPEPWVGWYFNAALRAAPLPEGALTREKIEAARDFVRDRLLAGQARYHEERKRASAATGRWLTDASAALFLLTLACVLLKLPLLPVHELHGLVVFLGICAALVPALSAAFFGLRAYSEIELLEQQSARMEVVMTEAEQRVARMRLDRPLASQDLATEVFDVSSEMLQDVNGWADLFRVKAVEAG